ncbi:MAG: DNA repair protein RecO [bacterium]
MSLRKTEAIVLKSLRFRETSKILTLYTRAFGKMKVIAKGARSAKSRFGGSLELLNYISVVFYEKETRDLQLLSQADIIQSFPAIKHNLEKTAIAMAAGELLERLEVGVSPNSRMFKLLLEVLNGIDNAQARPMHCFQAFQVRLLSLSGLAPELKKCMRCQKSSPNEVLIDIAHGGFLCTKCRQATSPGMILSPETLHVLRSFQRSPIAKLNGLSLSAGDERQVAEFLAAYLKYHFDELRELKSLAFLKKIK